MNKTQKHFKARQVTGFAAAIKFDNPSDSTNITMTSFSKAFFAERCDDQHGESQAYAINDAGWSVGFSGADAMLWSPSGKATDLDAVLGSAWSDTDAVGINDSGDIIGYGDYDGGVYGFLLTPATTPALAAAFLSADAAPEPSTWAMMLVGLAGLGFAGCRRACAGPVTLAA